MTAGMVKVIDVAFNAAIKAGETELSEDALREINDRALGLLGFRLNVEDLQGMYRSRRRQPIPEKVRRPRKKAFGR